MFDDSMSFVKCLKTVFLNMMSLYYKVPLLQRTEALNWTLSTLWLHISLITERSLRVWITVLSPVYLAFKTLSNSYLLAIGSPNVCLNDKCA